MGSSVSVLFESPAKTNYLLAGNLFALWLVHSVIKYLRMRSYFRRLNIVGPTPLPFLGNMVGLFQRGLQKHDQYILNTYGKTTGFFETSTPIILTKDPNLIKFVTVKQFSNFVNRRGFEEFLTEPLSRILTVLKDNEWKNIRSLLTPTFTSGKLKSMSHCVYKCANNFDENFEDIINRNNGIFNSKDIFGGFTLDVISSSCFGIEIDAIKDPENIILKNAKESFQNPNILLVFFFPTLAKFLIKNGLHEMLHMKPYRFLQKIVGEVIARRRSKEEFREDFIQHMVDHEETESGAQAQGDWTKGYLKKSLTDTEISAQAVMFLAVGYETTATTLIFVAFNLATYPDCQKRLQEEIDRVRSELDGDINHDSLGKLPYLEAVISETLRLYPPAARIDRFCNSDSEYQDPDTKSVIKIPKGQLVAMSVWSVHHDPENYPEPEKFKPERFLDRSKIENEKFLPFGSGPRSCIASRFAMMEMKILLAKTLAKYEFQRCEKTPTPETLKIDNFGLIRPAEPIFLKVQRRSEL